MQQQLFIRMTFSQKSIGTKKTVSRKKYYFNELLKLPKIICTCPANLRDDALERAKMQICSVFTGT